MTFQPAALLLGISVHAAVEQFYRAATMGERLTAIDLIQTFSESWNQEIAVDIPLDTKNPEAVQEQGRALLEIFSEHVTPQSIRAVESEFRVPLVDPHSGNTLDVDLVGRLDLVEADVDGNPVVVDLKTLARKPSEIDLQHDLQLSAYSFAARRSGIVSYDCDVLLRLDVLTKTKKPGFSQHFAVRPPESDNAFCFLAVEVLHAIRADAFPPSPGWQCSACPIRHYCLFHSAQEKRSE